MGDISFKPLFWFWGVVGGVVALLGAGIIFAIWRLFADHWR